MNKMNKKGQVTIFIIIGVLLIISIGLLLFFTLSNSDTDETDTMPVQTQDVEFMIENCMKKTGLEGLNLLGQNGNYIDVPGLLEMNDTSLWIYQYSNVMPVLNSSIDEFQTWFDTQFERCVDYTGFVEYSIQHGKPKSRIQYGAEDVLISLDYPINITRGDQTRRIDRFENTINIRYRRVYERAREIVNAHFIQWFDYRNALSFVDQRDFSISYASNDENNLVFTIVDDKNPEAETFYVFNFATNLDRSNLRRTVTVTDADLAFPFPFVLSSPDRMAQLYLQNGVTVSNSQLYAWQEYFNTASREVTSHVEYTISGGIDPGPRRTETITWNLTYPIYHFGPDGTTFDPPQRLAIFWDDEKNPNTGPMGILYRGPLSDYTWMPMRTQADYNQSLVLADIQGFSEYSPLDCNKQSCKKVGVTSKNEPDNSILCAISAIIDTLLPILIIIVIILIIVTVGAAGAALAAAWQGFTLGIASGTLATGTAATLSTVVGSLTISVGTIATVAGITTIVGLASVGLGMLGADAYDSGTTSVSFVPTCDQIVIASCSGDSHLDSGYGTIQSTSQESQTIPEGGTLEFIVRAGEQVTLSAVAEECEKGDFHCYDCKISCEVTYK